MRYARKMGKGGMVYAEQGADVPMDSMQGEPQGDQGGDMQRRPVAGIEHVLFGLYKELEDPRSTDLDKMLARKAIDRYEARRDEFMREGTYPRVWELLGDLDLGGKKTYDRGGRGEFNPTKGSSFGWDDVFYPLNDK